MKFEAEKVDKLQKLAYLIRFSDKCLIKSY